MGLSKEDKTSVTGLVLAGGRAQRFGGMDKGLVAFRYCEANGKVSTKGNPNGAANNIAGIFNAKKTVLGLMPHPERMSDPLLGHTDGRKMFDSLVEAVA